MEIDTTNPSPNKPPIYAGLGIAEVWHHDGGRLRILRPMNGDGYVESTESDFLPTVTAETLTRLISGGLALDRRARRRKVRDSVAGPGTGSD